MTYDITNQGIRYTIPSETIAEELITDHIADTHKPITQAEINDTIKRVSAEIERIGCDCAAQGAPTKCGACGR